MAFDWVAPSTDSEPVGMPLVVVLGGSADRTTDGTENCPALVRSLQMNMAAEFVPRDMPPMLT